MILFIKICRNIDKIKFIIYINYVLILKLIKKNNDCIYLYLYLKGFDINLRFYYL